MSGEAIVTCLLQNSAGLIAVVPATRIQADVLPLNTALPAISIQQITGNQHNTLKMGETSYVVTDRVQVTVLAATKPEVRSILALVRAALPHTKAVVNTFVCQSITPDNEGPPFKDAVNMIRSQSQDYMVSFTR